MNIIVGHLSTWLMYRLVFTYAYTHAQTCTKHWLLTLEIKYLPFVFGLGRNYKVNT